MLEAALVLPVILLLASFFLAQIRSVRYETIVAYALDQTAEETALLIPLGDAVLEGIGAGDIAESLGEWLPGEALADQLLAMTADVSSSLLFGRFIHGRLNFWLDEAGATSGFSFPPFEKRLGLFWQDEGSGLHLYLSYQVNTAFFSRTVTVKSLVPLWTDALGVKREDGEIPEEEEHSYDPIWSLSNFDRGAKFRELYGANLPFSFPVVAARNGSEIVSIKSMDLTAPSYASAVSALMQIEQHGQVLSGFNGITWGDHTILPGDIGSRKLLLIVPENVPAYADSEFFAEATLRLSLRGVTLEIARHGASGRYADLNEPQN